MINLNPILNGNKTSKTGFYNKHSIDTPWKGLGHVLTPNASIEQHQTESQLNFEIEKSPVEFWHDGELKTMSNRFVNYRNDTGHAFETVSDRYKNVQPRTMFEFFHNMSEKFNMDLKVAGSIDNGRKYFALAKINNTENMDISKNDKVSAYGLMGGSGDGSSSTYFNLLGIREVCTNTLTMINSKNIIRVHHSSKFALKDVQDKLTMINNEIGVHTEKCQKMNRASIDRETALKFFLELLTTPEEKKQGVTYIDTMASKKRSVEKLLNSYDTAPGNEPTLWGAVNAVTHSVDYNPSARTQDSRLNSAWFGVGNVQKTQAFELAQNNEFLDSIIDNTSNSGNVGINNLLDMVDL